MLAKFLVGICLVLHAAALAMTEDPCPPTAAKLDPLYSAERSDPDFPGTKLRKYPVPAADHPRAEGIRWYVRELRAKVTWQPKYFSLFGLRNTSFQRRNAVELPDIEGMNQRCDALARSGSPFAPQVRLEADTSPKGLGHREMLRRWGENGTVPWSVEGRTDIDDLHYHDIDGHFWGYSLLPKDFVDESRKAARELLTLRAKAITAEEKLALDAQIRAETHFLDELSGSIAFNVWASNPLKLTEEKFLSMMEKGMEKALRGRNPKPDLSPALRNFYRNLKALSEKD